jgi:hypothetical protein
MATLPGSGPPQDVDARNTYRYLRAAPLVVALFLALGVVFQWNTADCKEASISAFYYTSAHAVFVAALCAIGVCLIVYQGSSPFEDVVLNISGFLAFLVAMVPTYEAVPSVCRGAPVILPTPGPIQLNVAAVFLAGIAAELVRWLLVRKFWQLPADSGYRQWHVLLAGVVGYVLVVFLGWRYLTAFDPWFLHNAHDWSAISMFGGIILLIASNAFGAVRELLGGTAQRRRTLAATVLYAVSGLGMVVGLWITLRRKTESGAADPDVFWAEVTVITAFALFWLTQTIELWDFRDREAKQAATTG